MLVRVDLLDDCIGGNTKVDVEVTEVTAMSVMRAVLDKDATGETQVEVTVLAEGVRTRANGGIWGVVELGDGEHTICCFVVYTEFKD